MAKQIIGYQSKYNLYPNSIQCADSYFGIKSCKYQQNGMCDGHLYNDSDIPQMVLDDEENILDGCMLEIFLNMWGTSIREIVIGKTGKRIKFSNLETEIKKVQTGFKNDR